MTRYYLRLPQPELARGSHPELSFQSHGAEGFAAELQAALRDNSLFNRWKAMQDEPDEVDASLGAVDVDADVQGEQSGLSIELVVSTSLSGDRLRQRLRWLAGSHWELRDVKAG